MSTGVGALSHLVEAASALADMQPKPSRDSMKRSNEDSVRNKREIFPERLMSILNDSALSDIVTWLPHGRSFVIIRPDVFAEKVMPTYFPSPDAKTSTKYPSFTRKLNRWGFRQATRGPDTGAFHHPLFRRDQPRLCLDMVCQRSRNSAKQSKAKQAENNVKIAPLTKESLDAILPSTAENTERKEHVATVSVSEESSNSEESRGAAASNNHKQDATATTAAAAMPVPAIKRGISSDKDFVQRVLKDHEEMERLRIAKVMLYRAYVEAMQGAEAQR